MMDFSGQELVDNEVPDVRLAATSCVSSTRSATDNKSAAVAASSSRSGGAAVSVRPSDRPVLFLNQNRSITTSDVITHWGRARWTTRARMYNVTETKT